MIEALEVNFKAPAYIMKIIRSYLKDRKLIYQADGKKHIINVTSGAAQGSILGPELWNISYDGILNIEMPPDTYLVGYADDVAAVISGRDVEDVQRKLNQVMLRTKEWLDLHGLKLAGIGSNHWKTYPIKRGNACSIGHNIYPKLYKVSRIKARF